MPKYPADWYDITDRLIEYETGKVWTCDCGQDIGVPLEMEVVKCMHCNTPNYDRKYEDRPINPRTAGETTLGDFV